MPILFEKHNHVGILTLSRPDARNSWGDDFDTGLADWCEKLEHDREIRCVILTGDDSGRAFSAGANLKDPKAHTKASVADFIEELPRSRRSISNTLADFPKPVIAAVNGYAIGVGCVATLACDLIVASEKAEWRMPQVKLGLLPAHGGTVRLAKWAGRGTAMRMGLGFKVDAEEAYRIGLAQWKTAHEELIPKALEIAEEIAQLPPLATRLVKESVNRGLELSNLADAALVDVYRFMILQQTEDSQDAHLAWREGRQPTIAGR